MNEKVIRKTSDTVAAVWCVLYPNLNYPSYPMNVTLIVMSWQKNIQSNTSNIYQLQMGMNASLNQISQIVVSFRIIFPRLETLLIKVVLTSGLPSGFHFHII